jgi:hypothetical protein
MCEPKPHRNTCGEINIKLGDCDFSRHIRRQPLTPFPAAGVRPPRAVN